MRCRCRRRSDRGWGAADRGDITDDGGRDDRADAVGLSHARRGYSDVGPASGQGHSGDVGDPVSTLRGRVRALARRTTVERRVP